MFQTDALKNKKNSKFCKVMYILKGKFSLKFTKKYTWDFRSTNLYKQLIKDSRQNSICFQLDKTASELTSFVENAEI